mgnify:CR=1 FL=1
MPPNDWSSRPPPSLGHVRPDRPGHAPPPPLRPAPRQPTHLSRSPAAATKPRRRSIGIATIVFLALAGCIAAGVGLLVAMPPVDMVRDRIVAEVEQQTGRKVTIGEAGVSFTSGLGVSLAGVTLSATPAAGGGPLLAVERMEVALSLLPLIAREVRIDRLTLIKPTLDLRVDASGRRSWDFAAHSAPVRYAQAAGHMTDADALPAEVKEFARNGTAPGAVSLRRAMDGLSLADIRVVDGRVTYADARTGLVRVVSGIDANISLPAAGSTLQLMGHFAMAAERFAVEARIERFAELMAGRPVAASVKLNGPTFRASYDGRLASLRRLAGEGQLRMEAPSAVPLAWLMGASLGGLESVGPLAFDGRLRLSPGAAAVTAATFTAGATRGTGAFSLETAADRPRIVANLRFAALDAERLSVVEATDATERQGSAGRFALPAGSLPGAAAPRSIDELLVREQAESPPAPSTKGHGFRLRTGNQWDIDAIDTSALRKADADVRIQVVSLTAGRLQVGAIQAGIDLKAGLMRLSVTDGELAGGAVRGLVSVDARQPALTIGVNLSGDHVALRPIFEAAGLEPLEGKGRIIVAMSAQGASERELVSTLAGRAELRVADGALLGWDADAIVAGLAHGKMPPAHRQPGARTPFKELSATFQVAHGVARTHDFKLESPSLLANGTGTINIVDRNIDFVVKPHVAAGGLEVPVRVAGTWGDPTVVADVAGALKSPQAQEAARQLKEGNVEGALRSVLGRGPKADEKISKAKEALRNLLGR